MAPAEQDPGTKYEIRQQIGKGSFGSAFLVSHKQDKMEYVLKRVRLAKQTKWQRNSTLQEKDLANNLRHPFIVPCVESWMVQNHTVNIIYAFCQNGDLASYLMRRQKEEGQVDEGLLQKWLCQLLLALDYLQTQHVLHRDIKTSNLMLTIDNDVQLGDFGLATYMECHGDESKPQDTNLVGTPYYMSPEVFSAKTYGFKTDVWSLGCVFYELTAQRPAFNAFDIHGLASKITKYKVAPLPDTYSVEWRDIIGLMLCKNPERRPSVQQLMALPALRPAMIQARERARELMPSVKLPPLLDPTPLTPQPLTHLYQSSGGQDSGELETSAGSGSDQQGEGASEPDSDSCRRGNAGPAGGLAVTQAVQASELSELWRANFGQLQHDTQEAGGRRHTFSFDQEASLQPQGLQHSSAALNAHTPDAANTSDCSPAGSITPVAAPDVPANCKVRYSCKGGSDSVAGGYKRMVTPPHAQVLQPGIKRTASERVAAAIAAAAGVSPRPASPRRASTARVSRHSHSISSKLSSACSSASQQPECEAASGYNPSPPPAAVASQTAIGSDTARQPCSADNAANRTSAGSAPHSRRSSSSATRHVSPYRVKQTSTAGVDRQAAPGDLSAALRFTSPCRTSNRPTSAGGAAKPLQHRPPWGAANGGRSVLTPGRQRPELSPARSRAVKQQPAAGTDQPDDPVKGRRRTTGEAGSAPRARKSAGGVRAAQHSKTPQEQEDPVGLPQRAPHVPAQEGAEAGPVPVQHDWLHSPRPQQPLQQSRCEVGPLTSVAAGKPSAQVLAGVLPLPSHQLRISDDEEGAVESAEVHSWTLGSPVYGKDVPAAYANCSAQLSSHMEQVHQTQTGASEPVEQGHAVTAAQQAATANADQQQHVPAARIVTNSSEPRRRRTGTQVEQHPVQCSRIRGSSAGRSTDGGSSVDTWGRTYAGAFNSRSSNSRSGGGVSSSCVPSQQESHGDPSSSGSPAADQLSLQVKPPPGPPHREVFQQLPEADQEQLLQRLDLLESAMMVIGGLVVHKRWTELRSVMQSAPLLPGRLYPGLAVETAADSELQPAASSGLQLGDVVVLGRSRRVRGQIRYIGPVAWDTSAADWVGMELDRPCGVDATQRGIKYFDCTPGCASFHRAADLSTLAE